MSFYALLMYFGSTRLAQDFHVLIESFCTMLCESSLIYNVFPCDSLAVYRAHFLCGRMTCGKLINDEGWCDI